MDPVDLSLVLLLDGSASVGYAEFGLMAGGLAAALRDAEVVAGLTAGAARESQCALLLYSGVGAQAVLLDWTRIGSAGDAAAFADAVDNAPRILRAGLTALGDALTAAGDLLAAAPTTSARAVVDIVMDGSANAGEPPETARDALVAAGVTVNALCVLHEEPDLQAYATRAVIGGAGAFAATCADFAGFAAAMRLKLVREVA